MRSVALVLAAAVLVVAGGALGGATVPGGGSPDTASGPPARFAEYVRPVTGALLRPFEPPPTPYAAGHRGVDLQARAGAVVAAAGAGVVRFAGSVAGRGVVVVAHSDGITTEYEPLRPSVAVGTVVRAGGAIGILRGRHAGCAQSCLHWGARRAGEYFDPLTLLGRLGPVRLLPWPRSG